MKSIPFLVTICAGKTASIGNFEIDVPDDATYTGNIQKIIESSVVSIDVQTVTFIKKDNIVQFHCNISDFPKNQVDIVYTVNDAELEEIIKCFGHKKSLKYASNELQAVRIVKHIIDSYDPFVNIIEKWVKFES